MYAATMDILVLQIFNSLFYASVLFLIAAGYFCESRSPHRC
jgi:branched-subunit amino acid ABC-type transport system permease component